MMARRFRKWQLRTDAWVEVGPVGLFRKGQMHISPDDIEAGTCYRIDSSIQPYHQ